MKKRLLSFLLALCVLAQLGTYFIQDVQATCSRSENFSKDYTLTGNGAEDIISIAMAQVGKTGADLDYTEDWCADFVSDCAKLAGQSAAVPMNGSTTALMNAILASGGFDSTDAPQPGDICFINWDPDTSSNIDHVEIVYQVSGADVYTVGGNTGTSGYYKTNHVGLHSPISSRVIYRIVRPNYSGTPTPPPVISEGAGIYRIATSKDPLTLRSGPGTGYGALGKIPKDAYVTVFSITGSWGKVTYDGMTGYVSMSYCKSEALFADRGEDFYARLRTSNGAFLTGGGSVQTAREDSSDPRQIWHFQRQTNGTYQIYNCYDDGLLDCEDGLKTAADASGAYRQWYLTDEGYLVSAAGSAMVVETTALAPYSGGETQRLTLTLEASYERPGVPDAPVLTVPLIVTENTTISISWTESGLKHPLYDSRSYTFRMWDSSGTVWMDRSGLADPELLLQFPKADTWTVQVTAVNEKYAANNRTDSVPVQIVVGQRHIHVYSYTLLYAPTETASGALRGACECGDVTTVVLPPLNLEDYTYAVLKSATCQTEGTGRYTWNEQSYGVYYFDTVLPKTDHAYAPTYTVDRPATETQPGEKSRHCTTPGCTARTDVVQIPALGYTIGGKVVSPSANPITVALLQNGQQTEITSGSYSFSGLSDGTYTLRFTQSGMVRAECEVTVSGKSVTKDVTLYRQEELVTISHSLDLRGEIGVRYYLALKAGVTNPTMTAWRTETERLENVPGTLTGSEYLFVYNVYAMYISDDLTAQFTVEKDGVRYTLDNHVYSVQTYCENQLRKASASAKSKDLFAKLLNYGAYAQRYFNYRTDDLADANLATLGYPVTLDTSAVSAVQSTEGTDFAGKVKGHFNGNTLLLEEALGIRYYMVADEAVGDVYMAYRTQGTDQWQYVKAELAPNGSEYYATIANIPSYDIKNVYEAYFCEKTGDTYTQITQTKTYGAEVYAYKKLSGTNESLRSCVIALMMYADAARDYFGK